MKNISNESGPEFENDWAKAFEGAEIEPSEELWLKIDNELEKKQTRKYRKAIVFYQWVAAASIFVAIGISGITYYLNQQQPHLATPVAQDIIVIMPTQKAEIPDRNTVTVEEKRQASNNTANLLSTNNQENSITDKSKSSLKDFNNNGKLTQPIFTGKSINTSEVSSPNFVILKESENDHELTNGEIQKVSSKDYCFFKINTGKQIMAKTDKTDTNILYEVGTDKEIVYSTEKESDKKSPFLWAGVNFSTGYFNPKFTTNPVNNLPSNDYSNIMNSSAARVATPSSTEEAEEGGLYSFGFNVAVKVSKKWVIQSGIQYAYMNSSKKTGTYLENAADNTAYPAHMASLSKDGSAYARYNVAPQDYTVRNDFEFTSIPLKAGYFIVQKKMSWMVSFGVSTDIFIKNTLSSENDGLQQVTNVPGTKSPYKPLYFNGLVGSALSYNFLGNYSFSLEPSYRMGLGSFTKESASFTSNPYVFEIQAGIKYIF